MSSEIDKSALVTTDYTQETLNEEESHFDLDQKGGNVEELNDELKDDNDTFQEESSFANNTDLNTDTSQRSLESNRREMLTYYGKELMYFILALILSTYAILDKGMPTFERSPQPQRLFLDDYLVKDYPEGGLVALQKKISLNELSLVLYYAPWCAQSSSVKIPFESVARTYHKEVFFAAVNCWQPGGECRFHHGKIQSWPVIVAYYPNKPAVQYNGMWAERSLSKFVEGLLQPLKRITNKEQLSDMLIDNDAVVVGFFDSTNINTRFKKFFQLATSWLEHDPYQEIKYAVVTGNTVQQFNVTQQTPLIRMYLWNETHDYPSNYNWSSNALSSWMLKKLHYVSSWINPGDFKNDILSTFLNDHPSLLVFTPRDFYSDNNDGYYMTKLIAMHYFNCNNGSQNVYLSTEKITQKREEARVKYEKLKETCQLLCSSGSIRGDNYCSNSCTDRKETHYAMKHKTISNSTKCDGMRQEGQFCMKNKDLKQKTFHKLSFLSENTCDIVPKNIDYRSAVQLQKWAKCNECRQLKKNHGYTFFPPESYNVTDFEGISCSQNETLLFLLLDSIHYETYLRSLNLRPTSGKSTVLIVDNENESIYQMNEEVSDKAIVTFIKNYHSGLLGRKLRTKSKAKYQKHPKATIYLKELSSNEFNDYIETRNSTKVVLFYSSHCALCSMVSHSILAIALLLRDVDIEFLRVDGEKNDLMWHFTMETYPTVIIFPSHKSSDSRVFPSTLEPNITNMLGFIIANINTNDRLHSIIETCKYIKSCSRVLREEVSNQISVNLKLWRTFPTLRKSAFDELQALERIYFLSYKLDHLETLKKLKNEIMLLKQASLERH